MRYFIVFYAGFRYTFFGIFKILNFGWIGITSSKGYVNHRFAKDKIKETKGVEATVTGVLELNESDYNDFVSD